MRFEQHFGQSQSQKQTTKLAMTQELRQSIQMLQYNTEDLLAFLETKTLENPLMEVKVEVDEYDSGIKSHRVKSNYDGDNKEWLNEVPDTTVSLFDHLIQQVHLNYRDTYLRQLVLFLVEYIDVNGYLTISIEEAVAKTQATTIQMIDALTLLQMLEPVGVGARDLRECLMLQIEKDQTAPNMAYIIVEEYFEELANRKWQLIQKAYKIELFEIQEIFDYIKKLSPYPGAGFNPGPESYIIPDVIVKEHEGNLEVLSTKQGTPSVVFQQAYFEKMKRSEDAEVIQYLKERKAEFDWIKKGVVQRGNTILRVAEEIVKRQSGFFLDTNRPLVPMQLKELAASLSVHESTISRSINGKYLETDFGMFELRSFFTVGLAQELSEEELSTNMIKKKIEQIVAKENKQKPLSDQKIVELLLEETIQISRRTVAKYREELDIPSSTKRKRYDR
ncbi:RNA polymerase factor sigma-54 [Vagococcus hydrophili]|uniref:RNA polymerase factor sigma-54 n=1 Tax=Vagococcus hydrophili TaxID=2714947 RepID=A0A6G8AQ99_9ENTE|nr:RNA polymerase factor sigma-54 [Vagococcus hydrophili]QIL47251.1 RNA polymerase factor sigma-54 [Vagococcus hydrophili]